MGDRMMHSLLFLIAMMGLWRAEVWGAEPLPPRALARLGDHRFYHGPHVRCAVLSADGCRAASSSDGQGIILWDTATGERLRELNSPAAPIWRLAFSPDGKQLAAAYGPHPLGPFGVAIYKVETGKLLQQLEDFKSEANYLQFSADGKQLRVSEESGLVSAWDPANGKNLRLWKPPSGVPSTGNKVQQFARRGILSPNGTILVWRMDPFLEKGASVAAVVLRVHDAATDQLLYQKEFTLRRGGLGAFAFSADGKRFATGNHFAPGYGDKLVVWETASGKELAALDVPDMKCFTLAPDGQHAAIDAFGSPFRLWSLKTGKPSRDLIFGLDPQFDFSSDGKTLLVAANSTLRLFDTTSGKERVVSDHRTPVTPRFSGEGRTLFTSCHEWRSRWDVSRANNPVQLTSERRRVWGAGWLARSADDQLFLDCPESRVRVREIASGRIRCQLEAGVLFPVSAQFSLDSNQVLLGEFRDKHPSRFPDLFRLCDAKTGKTVGEIKPVMQASDPVFSPDGRFLSWADQVGAIHLHDTTTGTAIRTLRSSRPFAEAESSNVHLHFSPDSQYVIEGRSSSPMRVFQLSNSREILRFYANSEKKSKASQLSCLTCSPDDRLLVVAEKDSRTIRLLELASGKVRAEFVGHRHGVHGLAFAPDGKTLASGGEDNVVFLWDVTGADTTDPKTPHESDLPLLWNDLASEDGRRAGLAIAALLRKPQASAAFLQEHLRPAEALNEKRLAQWIADLDDEAFEKRETASRELTRLGERAEAALRRALTHRPSLEMRRRIQEVLSKLEPTPPPPELLRVLRAIEVLEHLGTPAARRCLQTLAGGATDARPTREAQAATRRLSKRRE